MTPEFEYNNFRVYRLTSDVERRWFLEDELGLSEDYITEIIPYLNTAGNLTIIHELYYTDKDWSSLLSLHYSTIFGQYPRFVDRIHIFKGIIDARQAIFNPVAHRDNYIGYFTVYPTRPRVIGRTHFRPSILGYTGGFMKCEEKVHIAGHELNINGFPFSGQDAKVISCAHVALWEIVRYYSTRYGYYGEYYQGDIAQLCEDSRYGRAIPTKGLDWPQILAGFSELRIRPIIYAIDLKSKPPKTHKYLLEIAKGYILSGIPVILAGLTNKDEGHAVVGVGMVDPTNSDSDIIVNDDNFLPYGVFSDQSMYCALNSKGLILVIVPLYSKIVLPFETAEKKSELIKDDQQLGLNGNAVSTQLSKRTFLTSSKTYLKSLTDRAEQTRYEIFARTTPLPKFVWITEFYDTTNSDYISAEYVIDATTSEYDVRPFILLKYPRGYWHNNRFDKADKIAETEFTETPGCPGIWERFPGNLR
ncbi:hypothetical protein KKG05_10015 [bacterium]|nr:hypothetical protein [Pseudomonadota bacterium]MBU1937720.1 hypothetical protein [bacterium]